MNFCYTGISILFADDMASARDNYLSYFKSLFQTVYSASDGREAWEIYLEKKPDILILDIEMPISTVWNWHAKYVKMICVPGLLSRRLTPMRVICYKPSSFISHVCCQNRSGVMR